jgi:hypothetical protein
MPPVILAVAAVAAYAGVSLVVVAAVVISAGTAIYGAAQARKAERQARDAMNAAMKDRMVTRIATEAPHRHIYGRAKVGADIVAMFTSGDRDEFRHLVCVHAAHECDAIEEIWVNNALVEDLDPLGDPMSGRYAVSADTITAEETSVGPTFMLHSSPRSGSVLAFSGTAPNMQPVNVTSVSGRSVTVDYTGPVTVTYEYFVPRNFSDPNTVEVEPQIRPVVRVQKHLGTPNDPVDGFLHGIMGDKWPTTAVLRGMCYTVITLDLNEPEFQGGLVPIHAVIRGKKLYDPRDGQTRWSQNVALAIRDYLISPLCGVPASDLPDAQFIAAANVCDEVLPTGGARYTINGTVTSDQSQTTVLESMTQAMAGSLVATTWDVYAGKYIAPVAALTQADIVGSMSVTPGVSDASVYSGVKGQYIGPENKYVLTDFTPYQNSVYREADGRDLWTNLDFPFTESLQRVTNLARIFVEDQRNGFTIKAEFSLKAWPLKVGQRITFTSAFLGQTAKVYRITDKSYAPNSAVQLTLKEDSASIWDYADAVVVDSTPNSDLPDPWRLDPLGLLNCTSGESTLLRQADGSTVPRILASWPALAQKNGMEVEVEWRAISSPTWERTTVSASETQAYLSPITPGYFYVVRARVVNPSLGVRSNGIVTVYQVEVFTATATVYRYAASKPAMPVGAASYQWSNGTFGAAPAGWSLTVPTAPAGGNVTLWAATVPISDISNVLSAFDWSQADIASIGYAPSAAGQGPAGYSNATVFAYQRKSTAPTGTPGAVDVDLTTGKITTATLANGWLKTIPQADGNPLYVTAASASAAGTTDTIATGEWSSAVVLANDGGAGAPGLNSATVTLYQRAATSTAPAKPSAAATYTFATGAITGLNNGWNTFIPTTGGAYLHTTFATAISASATDTIAATEWATVQLMYDATDLIAAKAAADAANTAITDMARDDLLSPVEKPAENLRWNAIVGERAGIDAQAAALGITTERTACTNAYDALNTYITGLGTGFTTIPGAAITIVGATYRTNFKNYYDAKQALLNAIAAKSATVAQWSGIGGAGKPADDASSDLALTASGTITITGNRVVKASGTTGWNAAASSKDGYIGGAFTSVRAEAIFDVIFGLNTDPATDANWTSIDYAMRLAPDGSLQVFEGGVARGAIGTYAVGDMLSIVYNGSSVVYSKNGAMLSTTSVPIPIAAPLFFDSSFNTVGSVLSNIRFGPMTSNNWASVGGTGKPQDNATVGAPAGTNVGSTPATTVEAGAAIGNKLGAAFSVSITGGGGGSEIYGAASGKSITVGTVTATLVGGSNFASVQWLIADEVGGTLTLQNATSTNVTIRSSIVSNPGHVYGTLICNVAGLDGRMVTASRPVHAEHL